LTASLDREVYRVGEALTATVLLRNEGTETAFVPRFDHQTLTFTCAQKDVGVPIRHDPVCSRSIAPESKDLEPAKSVLRKFLFTRLTAEEGEYALQVDFKGAISESGAVGHVIQSPLVFYRVVEPVALKRDRTSGLILKAQAMELAEREVGCKVTASRTVLVPLDDTGLYVWVVMLRTAPVEGPERGCAVQVNPYTGRAAPLELEKAQPALEDNPPAESAGVATVGSGDSLAGQGTPEERAP
jgi:hypothetical protein